MARLSTSQILRAVGDEHLTLVAGRGYWYFIYDDLPNNKFETHSVMTMRLSNLTLDQWVDEARDFLTRIKGA